MSVKPGSKAIQGEGTSLQQWQHSVSLSAVPAISLDALVPPACRLVVVAPHPDDEVLMCGGLLADLVARPQQDLLLISVTDGEASHRDSAHWSAHNLRQARVHESQAALRALGLNSASLNWLRVGLPDSGVPHHETELWHCLAQRLEPGDRLITTWREDGHCDHEAVGRACAKAARQLGASLLEAPVWAWHWASPEDARIPWHKARKLILDESSLRRKHQAISAHRSQITPDGDKAAVLSPHALERLLQPFELVFV
ncbi:PIG-L deacetylase family protein [Pseudomonas vanderleydeniana]|uniref:PIG-L family deacetylase n=1 Tax=Pseudomonas vanderleydeniana TaxID=2745495 RepID=A0A9E6PHQ1_9PSED|nr:PIG-L deacetylase family protein [Pseudomonas vanderleydeniana]QXI26311.1 PIG-L family deacetylase [Pseudomonas vanderleydeniana]